MPLCRFCSKPLKSTFADLGVSPLANSYVKTGCESMAEKFYPLHAYVCDECLLVQLDEFESPSNIFTDYSYLSSFSESWLEHCKHYAEKMVERFCLDSKSLVVEIASNDGYLLQYFKEKDINVLGIEPAKNIAKIAKEEKGIKTISEFFSLDFASSLAQKNTKSDLLIGNNVLAHVPDINDFVTGMKVILANDGIITMEFPHLLNLINLNQFDTIYHEHFSYLSLFVVQRLFAKHGLIIFDADILPTHGGSIRIYAAHENNNKITVSETVKSLLKKEAENGFLDIKTYLNFSEQVETTKRNILKALITLKEDGANIAAYGAPAKGNTLLNYCGIGTDFIQFTVDKNPLKQNTLLPGTRIPVYPVEELAARRPDYIVILPWNLKDEIMGQLKQSCDWNPKYISFIPNLEIV